MEKATNKTGMKPITISIKNTNPGNSTTSEVKLEQSMSFFLNGKRALDKHETDKAIELFKTAIENLGKAKMELADTAVFYSYLGLAYQKKGWKDYAQAHFAKALKLNPTEEIALKNISPVKTENKALSISEKLKSFFKPQKQS